MSVTYFFFFFYNFMYIGNFNKTLEKSKQGSSFERGTKNRKDNRHFKVSRDRLKLVKSKAWVKRLDFKNRDELLLYYSRII